MSMKRAFVLAPFVFGVALFTMRPAIADDVRPPATVEEHQTLAKKYRDEAARFRDVAAEHHAMAAAFAKSHPDAKGGAKNHASEKMQQHCNALVKDAEKLATDAEKAADYHDLRAKELQGK